MLHSHNVRCPKIRVRYPTRAAKSTTFTIQLDFHVDLPFFLKSNVTRLKRKLTEKTSAKDVIESCGVPHPEVNAILVNGQSVGFDHTLANDADVEVFPVGSIGTMLTEEHLQDSQVLMFVADGFRQIGSQSPPSWL